VEGEREVAQAAGGVGVLASKSCHLPNDVGPGLEPVVKDGQASVGHKVGEAHFENCLSGEFEEKEGRIEVLKRSFGECSESRQNCMERRKGSWRTGQHVGANFAALLVPQVFVMR